MNRWRAFELLCGYLRQGLLDGPSPKSARVRWPLLINASSRHFVTPALAWCIKDRKDIPSAFLAYFEAVLSLNEKRNAALLQGLRRVVGALNDVRIEPMLLKGAARLLDGSYPAQSIRYLGDLDLLVAADDLSKAAAVTKELGFAAKPDDPVGSDHHHLPMLHDGVSGLGVELHRAAVHPPFDDILPAAWLWRDSRPIRLSGLRVTLPSATQAMTHNVVHDQLLHRHFERQSFELRQLVDFALIQARGEVDWAEVDRRFCDANKGEALATYAAFARELLGAPSLRLKNHASARSLLEFRRRMQTGAVIRSIAKDYLRRCRDEPLAPIRLFIPHSWGNRLRYVRAAFDKSVI